MASGQPYLKTVQTGSDVVNTVLDVLDRPEELYRRLTDSGRRTLGRTTFEKLYIERESVVDHDTRAVWGTCQAFALRHPGHEPARRPKAHGDLGGRRLSEHYLSH